MKGLYLYCLREKTDQAPITIRGIDGESRVFIVPYLGIEAVVSEVSLDEFASREIQLKAQEDLGWIKEKAFMHERVVQEAMRNDDNFLSVIPMRFGSIFKDKASLEERLNKDYSMIKEVLDKVHGKQEWSVKVYLVDKEQLEQAIKEKNATIKEKEKEIASLPEGLAFFREGELKEIVSAEIDKELNKIVQTIGESLENQAVASAKCRILEKELTGKPEPMVLNMAYLISEEKRENFKRDVDRLSEEIPKGFYFEYSGPWPPYNFTSYQRI